VPLKKGTESPGERRKLKRNREKLESDSQHKTPAGKKMASSLLIKSTMPRLASHIWQRANQLGETGSRLTRWTKNLADSLLLPLSLLPVFFSINKIHAGSHLWRQMPDLVWFRERRQYKNDVPENRPASNVEYIPGEEDNHVVRGTALPGLIRGDEERGIAGFISMNRPTLITGLPPLSRSQSSRLEQYIPVPLVPKRTPGEVLNRNIARPIQASSAHPLNKISKSDSEPVAFAKEESLMTDRQQLQQAYPKRLLPQVPLPARQGLLHSTFITKALSLIHQNMLSLTKSRISQAEADDTRHRQSMPIKPNSKESGPPADYRPLQPPESRLSWRSTSHPFRPGEVTDSASMEERATQSISSDAPGAMEYSEKPAFNLLTPERLIPDRKTGFALREVGLPNQMASPAYTLQQKEAPPRVGQKQLVEGTPIDLSSSLIPEQGMDTFTDIQRMQINQGQRFPFGPTEGEYEEQPPVTSHDSQATPYAGNAHQQPSLIRRPFARPLVSAKSPEVAESHSIPTKSQGKASSQHTAVHKSSLTTHSKPSSKGEESHITPSFIEREVTGAVQAEDNARYSAEPGIKRDIADITGLVASMSRGSISYGSQPVPELTLARASRPAEPAPPVRTEVRAVENPRESVAPDIDAIARDVYLILKRRLATEKERVWG